MRMPEAEMNEPRRNAGIPLVQRRVTGDGSGVAVAPPIVQDVLNSPGRPLDAATRSFFEPRFGHHFGQVRIHVGERAEQSARDVNAHAYAVGHNVVFGAGKFEPGTHAGLHLIAHELMHVVQQAGHAGAPVVRRQPRPDVAKFKIISWRIWRVAGRDIVIIETNTGIRRAFYRRTGWGDKGVGHAPPERGWAPFRGLEPHPGDPSKPWFNKSAYYNTVHPENELRGYGNTLNKEIADWLDNQYITHGQEMPWQQVRREMDDVIRRPSLAPVSPPTATASGEIGGRGSAKPSPGSAPSTAAKVESTTTKVESAAGKVELKALAAEGGAAVELAGAAAKGGRFARLGSFLLAAAMVGPLDVLFLYIGFFGSIAEAKAKLRKEYYALGFAEGMAAYLLGIRRSEAMDMLVKPAGMPEINERVGGTEYIRDRATSSGGIDGYGFAATLTRKQRIAFRKEGKGVIATKGHTIGRYNRYDVLEYNFDDVLDLGIALKPLVEELLELAQEQEMARRTRKMVEAMYEDTESMWQK